MKVYVLVEDCGEGCGEDTLGVAMSVEGAQAIAEEHKTRHTTQLEWKTDYAPSQLLDGIPRQGAEPYIRARNSAGTEFEIQTHELNDAHVLTAAAGILKGRFALFTSDLQRGLERAADQIAMESHPELNEHPQS